MKCEIIEDKYGTYCIPYSSIHRPLPQRLLKGKEHEPETKKYLSNYKKVIHAGAYFGDMLPALRGLGSRLIALEPVAENFKCCVYTALLNDLSTSLQNYALSDKIEKLKMELDGGGSRVASEGEIVQAITIDSLEWIPDVIHLDLEGFESRALLGASWTLSKGPILVLETPPSWINEIGYHYQGKLDRNFVYKKKL